MRKPEKILKFLAETAFHEMAGAWNSPSRRREAGYTQRPGAGCPKQGPEPMLHLVKDDEDS